jgi:hypothetical protein
MGSLPTSGSPYSPGELEVFSILKRTSWIPPSNINNLYLPPGFFHHKTHSPKALSFGKSRFRGAHDGANTSDPSFDIWSSSRLPASSAISQGVSPANVIPRISVNIQRRKRKPSLANSMPSWRESWLETISMSVPSPHEEERPATRDRGPDSIIYSEYSDDLYGTQVINTKDSIKAWQTSALGNPQVTEFIEETFEFQDATFSKPTGLSGPLLDVDMPPSNQKESAALDLDAEFLAALSSAPKTHVRSEPVMPLPKESLNPKSSRKFVQDILDEEAGINTAHLTTIPTNEPLKPEESSQHTSNRPALSLTEAEGARGSVECSTPALNLIAEQVHNAFQDGHAVGPDAKRVPTQPQTDDPITKTTDNSPESSVPKRQNRQLYVVNLPPCVPSPDLAPNTAPLETSLSQENSHISREAFKDESKPASKAQTMEKAIALLIKLDDDRSTIENDEDSNICDETAAEDEDSSLLADLNAAFIEAGYGAASVNYRCLSDDGTEIDSELDKTEFEFGALELSYATRDEIDMSFDEMKVKFSGVYFLLYFC